MTCRSASVLLSDQEVEAIENGLRLLYRPITLHWDRQLSKFREPRQSTLIGFEEQDLVHLMRETGRIVKDGDGEVVKDGKGEPRTHKERIESRVLRRIHDTAVFPDEYKFEHPDLEPGVPCWLLVLGERVG